MRNLIIAVVIVLAFAGAAFARTITVGLGPGYDFNTIWDAVEASNNGDIVLVAPDTYTDYVEICDKAITVKSENGPNDCTIAGGFFIVNYDNHEPNESLVDGFTILDGGIDCYASSPAINNCNIKSEYNGIFCAHGSSPNITNCTITSANASPNSAGILYRDFYMDDSNLTITNCNICNNSIGIWCRDDCNLTITNCTINNNSCGIFCKGGDNLTIKDSAITNNKGSGGIYCEQDNLTITNSRIEGNHSDSIDYFYPYAYGGVVCHGNLIITDSTIRDNTAYWVGGILCGGNLIMSNCTVSGNWSGGIICGYHYSMWDSSNIIPNQLDGIFSGSVTSMITNSVITGNGYYGGIYCCGGPLTINNCTISGNTGRCNTEYDCYDYIGGGIHCDYTDLTIVNSILWDNKAPYGPQIALRDSNASVSYSDVQGPNGIYVGERSNLNWGAGNIDTDPCFIELGNGYWDGYWDTNSTPGAIWKEFWVWIDGDYHLLPSSPCIDTGDPNYISEPSDTDLDGNPRVMGPAIDMGAYEYRPPIPAEVNIEPDTLNLQSKGNWITCHIRLPEAYNVADIDPNSIFLEDIIAADSLQINNNVAVVKFSRSEAQSLLSIGENEITVTGELLDGTVFKGIDTIRVINKGNKK